MFGGSGPMERRPAGVEARDEGDAAACERCV